MKPIDISKFEKNKKVLKSLTINHDPIFVDNFAEDEKEYKKLFLKLMDFAKDNGYEFVIFAHTYDTIKKKPSELCCVCKEKDIIDMSKIYADKKLDMQVIGPLF